MEFKSPDRDEFASRELEMIAQPQAWASQTLTRVYWISASPDSRLLEVMEAEEIRTRLRAQRTARSLWREACAKFETQECMRLDDLAPVYVRKIIRAAAEEVERAGQSQLPGTAGHRPRPV